MISEYEIINGCLQNKRKSQDELYRLFSSKMFAVCLRYAANREEAEDMLQDGFIRVFSSLNDFRQEGSLEGWIRRTMINTAINYYRKNLKFSNDMVMKETDCLGCAETEVLSKLSADELMGLVRHLPQGYRMVFNMNVIEGYTHKEIAGMLNISINTSKSQLMKARITLKAKVKEMWNQLPDYATAQSFAAS